MPSGEWMGNFMLCIIKWDRCRCLPDIFPYIKSKHPREFNDRVHCTATQLLVTLNWIHDSFVHNAVPCICFQYYLCHVIYSAHAALSESVIPDTGALSWQSSARVLVSIQEVLGRLLGMLFQWFDATAYLPDGTYVTLIVVLQSLISDQRMAHIYFYFKSY